MNKFTFLLLAFFGIQSASFAQIKGLITDENGDPMPYVSIYLPEINKGTISNDDGNYQIDINTPGNYTISFHYLGYKTISKTYEIVAFPYELNIQMLPEAQQLDAVIISSSEDPAYRVIRNAIAKRSEYRKQELSFTATFYSKGFYKVANVPKKILGQEIDDLDGTLDSVTRSGIVYLSETFSEIAYQAPNNFKETITASKVSGDDNGVSFNSAQSANFNFYDNTLDINRSIVSPIAENAMNYYRYKLQNTFYDIYGHLINQIEVIPKRSNDKVFSGTIYIVEDTWYIYGLELSVTGASSGNEFIDQLVFTQNFSYVPEKENWIKTSQFIDIEAGIFGINFNGRFTAVYSDYNFNPNFDNKYFGKVIYEYQEGATKKDSSFWDQNRPVPLSEEQSTDYVKKDSIRKTRTSRKYLDSIDRKSNKFKILDLINGYTYRNSYEKYNVGYTGVGRFSYNTVQGYTLNAGVFYNKTFYKPEDKDSLKPRRLRVGANAEYGFSDKRLRPTGSISYNAFTLSGGVRTRQFNEAEPIDRTVNAFYTLFLERNFMKIFDQGFLKLNHSRRLAPGLYAGFNIGYEDRRAVFNETFNTLIGSNNRFTSNDPLNPTDETSKTFERHKLMKADLGLVYRFGAKVFKYPNFEYDVSNQSLPTLRLSYRSAWFSNISDYDFQLLDFKVNYYLDLADKGKLGLSSSAGTFIDGGDINFIDFRHFNGNQTKIGTTSSYLEVFNILPYYQLSTNDDYFMAHAEYNLEGYLLNKIPLIKKLNYSLVFGGHILATQQKPYTEWSVGLDNVGYGKFRPLRIDYVRSNIGGVDNDALIIGLKFLEFF